MAGDHNLLKVDPAIERWALMRENTYKHFTWSPRNTRIVFFLGIVIPVGLTWLAFKTDGPLITRHWSIFINLTRTCLNTTFDPLMCPLVERMEFCRCSDEGGSEAQALRSERGDRNRWLGVTDSQWTFKGYQQDDGCELGHRELLIIKTNQNRPANASWHIRHCFGLVELRRVSYARCATSRRCHCCHFCELAEHITV
ncbi:hypothetical protein BC936DRAFT_149828 [Jimgerdemannia flammicorona]|uniref:NADH-ubiquinone oxidoreductase B15 subunit n=1 Tax=Jimgerdemannia flammicorona TaxID=994334 RepID=A0A433DN40_9FUNG|nr:hypothetical protein BC936DRAFT_149828 [Jimgerdemannia flammicorona]